MPDNHLAIKVVFAAAHDQYKIVDLTVPVGATLLQAIESSGLLALYPEIDLFTEDLQRRNQVGIFGQLKRLDHPLAEEDRVEIYRPLYKDPMQARKDRVQVVKKKKFKPLRAKDPA
ncbi:MAG TPA: RnfH family protein [Candidatus Berkiella sp.]|nr:RnfH family protein [Candidatus Berkiella sp.]